MGWKESQRRYKKRETLADQSTEDKVARRVLRGLGLSAKQLPILERRLFGKADFDEALWPRTLAVWKQLARVYHRCRAVEVVKLDARRGYNEILERLEEVDAEDGVKPVFLTIANTVKQGWAYIPMAEDYPMRSFTPPYKVLETINKMQLVIQGIEEYVASQGPYNLEMSNE